MERQIEYINLETGRLSYTISFKEEIRRLLTKEEYAEIEKLIEEKLKFFNAY